ncbi:5'(3')-deoxyribonucleotidase [Mucilaginibacter rubeus]|uniref:5'(3')-deoxyribonucleotidase n=1 Tax=Mucilaginibacter rubeus TaxID=2027860 RepID=A0AAE6JK46_9SPHI|nr:MULTISPECIES: 5'(3')-deoxyribonucleotidase [Mucilaginibacter]QEM07362.1 5'(3')-deoxyribonucleotidase [Mucilaginibacter rubeus]QEM19815.1 5'(3')-deoxyribonucleotidase [Mucilaginibacter gossypii]QTE43482.1 5'(3')-deoxyribonucleotidase [Mucilaginibacter rubeus]QTE50082.1 5'(3')-deoxyribonucleotidase [Mucilaginibacter rubeus]QTE55171.1 5'(3')-deoxyribonucleotidase [Mucilaginibacter rubeus]
MSINRKIRVAIDMDEVIADTIGKFISMYKERHGEEISLGNMEGKEFREILPPHLSETLRVYINERGFFRDIPVMPDAQEVVKALHEKYDVYIASAAMEFKYSLEDKQEWLEEHFPFISWTNIIFCGHKILDVDIMIDDRIKNFATFNGRKILYTSTHNMLLTDYERVNTWKEVAAKLL